MLNLLVLSLVLMLPVMESISVTISAIENKVEEQYLLLLD